MKSEGAVHRLVFIVVLPTTVQALLIGWLAFGHPRWAAAEIHINGDTGIVKNRKLAIGLLPVRRPVSVRPRVLRPHGQAADIG